MLQRILVACGLALVALGAPVTAQQPAAAPEMRRLAFLEGVWEGTGWMVMGPSGRKEFSIRESARWGAGGNVMVLDGLGVEKLGDGSERPVHQAFAVISWDPAASVFRLRAYRAGGGEVEDTPAVSENGLVWGFREPRGGHIRFTVRFTDDTWHEVGEYSPDGATWQSFLDMRLERKATAR